MNLGLVITAVLDRYSEATNQRFVDIADVKLAVQEGYDWISDATEWDEVRVPIRVRSGRCYYDIRSYADGDALLYAREFFHPLSGRWLEMVATRFLDLDVYPFWEEVYGNPWRVCFPAYGWVGFHPQPEGDEDLIVMNAVRLPVQLSANADTPGFPSQFHLALVEYALCEIYSQDGETELALEHWGRPPNPDMGDLGSGYLRYEAELAAYVHARATMDRNTVVGMGYPIGREGGVR